MKKLFIKGYHKENEMASHKKIIQGIHINDKGAISAIHKEA